MTFFSGLRGGLVQMLRSSVNVSVGLAGVGGGSDVDMLVNMAGGNPRAKWQLAIQLQVKKHSVISKKWVNLVDEAVRRVQAGRIKMCNARLAVETVSATTSKTSTVANQGVRVFKLVAAHSAPAPDQPNQTLSSEEDLFIKLPGFFKELPRNQTITLARLLLIFFSLPFSFQILEEILEEDPPDEAIPEVIFIIVYVFVLVQQIPEGTNLLQDGMEIATNKHIQFLSLCGIVLMSQIGGAHAKDSTKGIEQNGKAVETHDSFKIAAFTLAAIGGAALWRMLRRRPAIPVFGVDECLRNSPIPRRSDPAFIIHSAV